MTINEQIQFCQEKQEREVYSQIISNLEKLKRYKILVNHSREIARRNYDAGLFDGKHNSINLFSKLLKARLTDAIYQKDVASMENLIDEIANEIKERGE